MLEEEFLKEYDMDRVKISTDVISRCDPWRTRKAVQNVEG